MAKGDRQKLGASKRKASEDDNIPKSGSKRKIKFSGKNAKETAEAMTSSGKQSSSSAVKSPLRTRSGRKVKVKQFDYDSTVATNNNATRFAKSTPQTKNCKSVRTRVQGGQRSSVSKTPPVSHDKEHDIRHFNNLDRIRVESDGEIEFDGIDVTINPSDDEEFAELERNTEFVHHETVTTPVFDNIGNTGTGSVISMDPTETVVGNVPEGSLDVTKLQQENTNLKMLIDELVNQRVQLKLAENRLPVPSMSGAVNTTAPAPQIIDQRLQAPTSAKRSKGKIIKPGVLEVVKLPSDTTIYAPALHQGKRMENALE